MNTQNIVGFPNRHAKFTDSAIEAMTDHWQTTLGNVPSDSLRASWRQAFVTFNRKIDEQGTRYEADWHILSPKTGTGKSESLKVYAAEVSRNSWTAPGILIVVRMIAQADEFVADINARVGEHIAAARHSQSDDIPLETLSDYPVLVITHSAFSGKVRRSEAWQHYTAYDGGRRKLVVIDEAIDVLDIARLDGDLMAKLSGAIPTHAQDRWPQGYAAMKTLQDIFEQIRKMPSGQTSEARVVLTSSRREYIQMFENGWSGFEELTAIREFMRSEDHRYLIGKRNVDSEAETRQKRIYDKIFADMLTIYDSFILHHKSGTQHTLNTATRILPDDGQGCVVLDATADTNPIYECMERDSYNVLKHTAISCRSYQNVTLRASFGHSVGRASLTRVKKGQPEPGARTEAPKLFNALAEEHKARADSNCPMERVLIVCHKDSKPHLAGFETPFEYALAHYGALDGRNDWRDYDSVVIFGLDYRHPADAPAQFMALQPEYQTDEWLRGNGKRAFKGYADIRAALDTGVITSSVVQAVNRIRTRRVVDAEGNCPESFVYMLLPGDTLGKAVYETLQAQMPGVELSPWSFKGARSVTRSKHEAALTEFLKGMVAGESWSATQLKAHLGISRSAWDRLAPKLGSDTTQIGQLMAELGVTFESTNGSGSRVVKA